MHGKRGSLLICLDELPPGVSRKELRRFVQRVADRARAGIEPLPSVDGPRHGPARRGLRLRSNITDCAILRVTNTLTGTVTFQGLVGIQPAKVALETCAALNQAVFNGFRINARRFHHRALHLPVDAATTADLLGAAQRSDLALAAPRRLDLVDATAPPPIAAPPAGGLAPVVTPALRVGPAPAMAPASAVVTGSGAAALPQPAAA